MIANIDRPTMIVGSVLSTVAVGGISGEHVATIAMGSAFVAAVVGGLAWLDARMDAKIKRHTDDEKELHDTRNALMLEQIKRMILERSMNDGDHNGA